jgi:hypothetical protein
MKDTMRILRKAIADCITGNISYGSNVVKVYDEKIFTGEVPTIYILLSTQQESSTEENDCTWITRSSIDIEVIAKSGFEVSKDIIDDVSNSMMELIAPLPGLNGFSQQSGFIISGIVRESALTRNVQISETQSILQKIVKFTATIIQQN